MLSITPLVLSTTSKVPEVTLGFWIIKNPLDHQDPLGTRSRHY